jgi:endonuclease/exonuclease/phosphatase (EEP) superfamily protein YafD
LVAALLLAFAYFARSVNPNDAWFFAFCGLIAPVLYIANIVTALYWILRWRWYALIPAAALLAGIGSVSLFFRPSLSKQYETDTRNLSRVMSYNVMGFLSDELHSTLDSTAAFIGTASPDILCIQEFQVVSSAQKQHLDSLIGLPYNVVNYKSHNSMGGGYGVAVYSRFPIIDSVFVNFEDTKNSSMWVDIATGGDTLRIFNNHLQTTMVNHKDRRYIDTHGYFHSDGREERVRSILSKLRRNFNVRASQADSLATMIAASPHKVIVCGDFNDTPMSYTYNRMRGNLNDAFVEKGSGMPNTYHGLFNIFRIDYILYSKGLQIAGYNTMEDGPSDHKPVVASFRHLNNIRGR